MAPLQAHDHVDPIHLRAEGRQRNPGDGNRITVDVHQRAVFLADLEQACADEKRWEFLFTVAPLRVERGTGSPVNPIAVL